jgi:lipopolysaccharide biosynthesis glycosyltransferase
MKHSIFVGYDGRETEAFAVCRRSLRRNVAPWVPIHAVDLQDLRGAGLYRRPTSVRDGRMWDDISEAPCSTEFAISRFLVPHLAHEGLALFMDCDMLVRADLDALFFWARRDASKAVWCVKHVHEPPHGIKMDGQEQTRYARKNWSSVVLWNVDHPANKLLTVDLINQVPGRDLHRFSWLADDEIGELDPKWNWLVGHSDPEIDPSIVHFTEGTPNMAGYENVPYADEWRRERALWLRGEMKVA